MSAADPGRPQPDGHPSTSGHLPASGHQSPSAHALSPADGFVPFREPAVLVGACMLFMSLVVALEAAKFAALGQRWGAMAVVATVLGIAALALGLVLVSHRRMATGTAVVMAGFVLLDLLPPTLQLAGFSPSSGRDLVVFLVLPAVMGATCLSRWTHRAHLIVVLAIAALMTALPAGRPTDERLLETALAVGVLAFADVLIRRLSQATEQRVRQLRELSQTDGLTGVLNRRGLTTGFAEMVRLSRRDTTIGLLVIDIDHFKWINDEHGHAAGDQILRQVCAVLGRVAGPANVVARIGGEELAAAVVGPAEPVAEAFRAALRAEVPAVTVSIGIVDVTHEQAVLPGRLWALLDAADRALYEAKNTGRDRICRGTVDAEAEEPAPALAVPAPQVAAVRPEPAPPVSTHPVMHGWALAGYAMICLLLMLAERAGEPFTPLLWAYIAGVVAIGGCAGVLIARRPSMGPVGLLLGSLCVDLIVVMGIASITDPIAKRVAALPLLITALLVAQYVARPWVLTHYAVVVAICAYAASALPVVPTVVVGLFLYLTVIIGSAELIYGLRRRYTIAADDLHRWSVTDPLTGLANRRGLELAFARMPRTRNIIVLALDVDDFKNVNDRHGHAVGDDSLIRLASTLHTVTGPGTVVGRTGGDEFVVLAPGGHPGTLTTRVSQAAALLPVPLSVSVGTTVAAPYHRLTLWQLVNAADAGLTRAKRARRVEPVPGIDTDDAPTIRSGRALRSVPPTAARGTVAYPDQDGKPASAS
jgi:diguanylate cyclase (GGDEF)-like protein